MKLAAALIALAAISPVLAQPASTGPAASTSGAPPAVAGSPSTGAAASSAAVAMTAAQAMQAKEDTEVTLEGTVVRKLGADTYEFRDASGTVVVEIDDDKWPNKKPTMNARVRLHGEVDRKLIRRTVEVEVERLELLR